jgi:hypothetical protein
MPWTPSEDAALIDQLGRGGSVEAIAATLRRGAAEVRARLDELAQATSETPVSIFPKDIAAS